MQFIIVVDGRIVGQIYWDGVGDPPVPDGAVLLTVGQAFELGLV